MEDSQTHSELEHTEVQLDRYICHNYLYTRIVLFHQTVGFEIEICTTTSWCDEENKTLL